MREIVKMCLLIRLTIGCCCLFMTTIALSAPKLSCVRQYSVDDGLSQSMVYSIIQDGRGYLWFGTQDGLNRFDGHEFTIYKKELNNPESVGSKGFFSAAEDSDGKIWFATTDGVKIYNPDRDEFMPFMARTSEGESVTGQVRDIHIEDDGSVWMCCRNGSLFRWNNGNLSVYDLSSIAGKAGSLNLRDMTIDEDGVIYVATYGDGLLVLNVRTGAASAHTVSDAGSNDMNVVYCLDSDTVLVGTSAYGVQVFDKSSQTFSSFHMDGVEDNLFVRSLMCCSDRMLWIGTENGLYVYDTRTFEVTLMRHSAGDPYSLSDNAVYAVFEDDNEGIWVGTYFGGVNYISKCPFFDKHYPVPGANSIGGRCISEFARSGGSLFIGTEDAGLYRYSLNSGVYEHVPIDACNIHALMSDGNDLWVGTFTKGVYLLDSETMRVKGKWTAHEGGLCSNDIYSIYKDSYGRIWCGAMTGLHYYDADSRKFVQVRQKSIRCQVNDIMEDGKGLLWFVTIGDGVYTYDTPRDKWRHYPYVCDEHHDSRVNVNCILEDDEGRIWVGTDGSGLCLYDGETDSFSVRYDSRSGLLNDVIYALECDRLGNVWGSTNKGLFKIDVRTMTVSAFTHDNGILCDQFNYKSSFIDDDGTMYFGSIKGFVSFNPERMMLLESVSSPFIGQLYVDGNEVCIGGGILNEPVYETDSICLAHDVSSFSLELNEINYAESHNGVYYYKLDGWDKMWFTISVPSVVAYSNVPAGKYTFRLRSSMGDAGDLVRLNITVKSSVWTTWWAQFAYAVLVAGIIYLVISLLRRRAAERSAEKEKALAEERKKELYNAKLDFFSNITHEIRTPLSLIRMPLEGIVSKTPEKSPDYKDLLIIRENVDRLQSLVNQLLDFRKSNDRMDIQFVRVDITRVVSKTVSYFLSSVEDRNIELKLSIPDSLNADIDVEMFTKILSNLLSNALKHASASINVSLAKDGAMAVLSVSNDGDRIPEDMTEKIFDPFFKIDNDSDGFGIGLSFVRTLVELHGGVVSLVPHEDKLTEFRVCLPLEHENALHLNTKLMEEMAVEEPDCVYDIADAGKKKVLIVDDDSSFVEYLASQLKTMYKVKTIYTGEHALEYIAAHNVDIVIADINLSGINGIRLCENIKGDKRYVNIPVILLSNEKSREIKIAGISAGADIYIEKPCYVDYLVSCMENLFKSGYTRLSDEQIDSGLVYTKADEAFMNRLIELIYAHIEEVDLDVNMLASLMNMSRATLYRKVKDSLRVTPNDLIHIIRLKKAAELLRRNELRVNEIAYIVGFKSSSYFSKCFKKQYGVLPKDFV